jgi:S1-C subfamily serine protease
MQISRLDQRIGDLQVDSDSFSGIISDVIDATVSVNTNVGQGSGAIISEDGYVVTNYHVIKGARRASVTSYSGDVYGIRLIGYDATNDIAVLELVSNESFDYFIFGNSDNIEIGQKVVALGNPLGLSFTATEGIISSPSRVAQDGLTYIQTDVTLNPGNSGGPIIDSNGRLIGIANFKVAGYEGLGFAIPSNRVEDVVREIINEDSN